MVILLFELQETLTELLLIKKYMFFLPGGNFAGAGMAAKATSHN
jgi:hypothetical protein